MSGHAVTPVGESVTVSSSYRSNGDAYHTRECFNVRRMSAPKEVDRAVAEWKGLSECGRCQRLREGEP